MKKSRILAMIIAMLMLLAIFAGCNNNNEPAETTASTPAGTSGSTAASTSKATEESTTIPTVDVKGYDFVVAGDGGRFFPKMDGDAFASKKDEELQDKLDELETTLGCTITKLDISGKKIEAINLAGAANENLGDIVWLQQREFWAAAKANYLLPVDGEELVGAGLNIGDDERWYTPTMEWSTLFGHMWTLDCASKYVAPQTGYFVTFNKALCANIGYTDMYKLADDYMWTWSVYREVANKACYDNDGDGAFDIWGTGATAWGNEAVCNGVQYVGEVDGKWQCTIRSAAGIEALQFLYDMNFGDKSRLDLSSGTCREEFAAGHIAFNWCQMGHLDPGSQIQGSNHDYGIIPMPMGPRATEYMSMNDNLNGFVIQTANKNIDKTVLVLNELALIWNSKETRYDMLDDGRCRTEQDKEQMINHIIPNFSLNMGKMNDAVWGYVDDTDDVGLISDVSYNGKSPMQAIETWEQKINEALDAFFGQ